MFENNTVQRILVNLTLADGSKLIVSAKLPMSGKLNDMLNNGDRYLDVLGAEGEQYFLAKEQVLRVVVANPPKAGLNFNRRSVDGMTFNPWVVLGVANGSSPDAIKMAYRNLVKMYHPDRFANMDLPPEMKDYAAAMLARINIAHDQLASASEPK